MTAFILRVHLKFILKNMKNKLFFLTEENRLNNKTFKINGFVFSQHSKVFSKMRYGIKPMSHNGCGIIAVYNALLLLGEKPDFHNAAEYFEKHGKWFFGLLGTKPWKFGGYLKKFGFKTKLCSPETAENGVYIITVWNKRPGMHYMAVNKTENGIYVYNGYRRRDTYDHYRNFESFFEDTCIKCLLLMRIL